jgi:hypothetical protein
MTVRWPNDATADGKDHSERLEGKFCGRQMRHQS